MHTTYALFLTCFIVSVLELTRAQSIHVIQVGDTGSFYDPQVTAARTGDTVSFQWTGMFHTVTQSSFDNPCTPLSGGFDSGFAGNPSQQLIIPEWNITITDDTQPIWFFCKSTKPVPHCTNGMVGAINADLANGNQSFNNFSQNAKAITTNLTYPVVSPVLSGMGAVATSAPQPVHNITNATSSIIPTSSTSSSTTISSPAIQTQQNSSQSSGLSTGVKGGIAGGSVGLVLLVILLVLLFMSYRRGRRYRKEAKTMQELRSKSSRDMSHIDRMDLIYDTAHPPLPPGPLTPSQQVVQMHRSQGSLSVNESLERDSTSGPSVNIRELAAEIAKNIRQDINIGNAHEPPGLAAVPEQVVADAVSRAGSSRAAESGRGRQLPMPPQSRSDAGADVRSIDTLPAYVPGHSR